MPLKLLRRTHVAELFDPVKLRKGLEKACYKRPVSHDQLEDIVRRLKTASMRTTSVRCRLR